MTHVFCWHICNCGHLTHKLASRVKSQMLNSMVFSIATIPCMGYVWGIRNLYEPVTILSSLIPTLVVAILAFLTPFLTTRWLGWFLILWDPQSLFPLPVWEYLFSILGKYFSFHVCSSCSFYCHTFKYPKDLGCAKQKPKTSSDNFLLLTLPLR